MSELDLDKLGELTNIGAGHAATACSNLTGRTIWMGVPRVRKVEPPSPTHEWTTGVIFELEGYLSAILGILFQAGASEDLVRRVVGMDEGELAPHVIESALMEVGNILASHVASAIADAVGQRLLPAIPTLAMNHAEGEMAALLEHRSARHDVRIECELLDDAGKHVGLVVLLPEGPAG